MVTDEILRLKANASEEELKLESKTIVGTYVSVIENSDDDFFWVGCSQMNSFSLFDNYSPLEDREIIRLCRIAINEAERHSDNLGAYVAELEARVKEGIPLEDEYNKLSSGSITDDGIWEGLIAWSNEHEGFSKEKLREDEFILGYCRALMKERRTDSDPLEMDDNDIEKPTLIPRAIMKATNDEYIQEATIGGENKYVNQKDTLPELVKALYNKYGDRMPTDKDIRFFVVDKMTLKPYSQPAVSSAFKKIKEKIK